jgi:hypothetical protein
MNKEGWKLAKLTHFLLFPEPLSELIETKDHAIRGYFSGVGNFQTYDRWLISNR